MSLASAVAAYIPAYNAHTDVEGEMLHDVYKYINEAPLDEIQDEYNRLTAENEWVPPLAETFYDYLLDKILNDTGYLISYNDEGQVFVSIAFGTNLELPSYEHKVDITDLDLGTEIIKSLIVGVGNSILEDKKFVGFLLPNGKALLIKNVDLSKLQQNPAEFYIDEEWESLRDMYLGLKDNRPNVVLEEKEETVEEADMAEEELSEEEDSDQEYIEAVEKELEEDSLYAISQELEKEEQEELI